MAYNPDEMYDEATPPEHGLLAWARRQHDENPDRYHSRRIVQMRINNGLSPCHYCKFETVEIPLLNEGDEDG